MAQEADRRAIEWASSSADASYFAHHFGVIDEPQGDDVATLPFHLWPTQVALMWQIMSERLIIILKARQLGISWLVCVYALWLCLFQPGRLVLLFSKGQLEADELARRVRVLYQRLPEWVRAAAPAMIKDNNSELMWANESRVLSLPATQSAGRTFTATLVVMDECAFMHYAASLYNALKPTIDGGGKIILLSTANGKSNFFAELWGKAVRQKSGYIPLFLPWHAAPARDTAWRARVENESIDASLVKQEYPATPEEAFSATDHARFMPSMILWDACAGPLPIFPRNWPMVLGVDAGVSNDAFGLVGVSRHPTDKRIVVVRLVRAWVPRGKPLDFDLIQVEIEQICKDFVITQIAYDPYQLHQLSGNLERRGIVWMAAFSQQQERLEADKQLLDITMNRTILHDGNEILRQHIDNADRQVDTEEHKLRIIKRKTEFKVDLAVALSMAAKRCLELNI